MVQVAANAYIANIDIIDEHGRVVTIEARESVGPHFVITFNSQSQHYQSTIPYIDFNIDNYQNDDVDKQNSDDYKHYSDVNKQDSDIDKQDGDVNKQDNVDDMQTTDEDEGDPKSFKDLLGALSDASDENIDTDEEVGGSFKKELRTLHANGRLRQILIDGKTDESKNPMLMFKNRGPKGFSQLAYVIDNNPNSIVNTLICRTNKIILIIFIHLLGRITKIFLISLRNVTLMYLCMH